MNQPLRYTPLGRKVRKILWLKNWPAVIGNSRLGKPLPPFDLRGGTYGIVDRECEIDIEGAEVEALGKVSVEAMALVQRIAMEYHENIRPGSLALIREKLRLAGLEHQILFPDPDGSGLGILQARRAHS